MLNKYGFNIINEQDEQEVYDHDYNKVWYQKCEAVRDALVGIEDYYRGEFTNPGVVRDDIKKCN